MSAPGELRGDEPGLCDGVGGEVYNPEAVTRAGRAASLGKNPEREKPERGAEVFEAFGARCSRARNGRGKNRGVRGRRAEPCRRKAACGGAYPGRQNNDRFDAGGGFEGRHQAPRMPHRENLKCNDFGFGVGREKIHDFVQSRSGFRPRTDDGRKAEPGFGRIIKHGSRERCGLTDKSHGAGGGKFRDVTHVKPDIRAHDPDGIRADQVNAALTGGLSELILPETVFGPGAFAGRYKHVGNAERGTVFEHRLNARRGRGDDTELRRMREVA